MRSIPWLLIPVLIAHALLLSGVDPSAEWLRFTLPSTREFVLSSGDVVLALALLTLFVEVYKSTLASRAAMLDQVLSLLLFVVVLLEFLLWPAAGQQLFFFLTVLCLVDVIAGFVIGMAVARRDIGILRE